MKKWWLTVSGPYCEMKHRREWFYIGKGWWCCARCWKLRFF